MLTFYVIYLGYNHRISVDFMWVSSRVELGEGYCCESGPSCTSVQFDCSSNG